MAEVVIRSEAQGLVQHIETGGHAFTSDEPVSAGGTDRGPSPYELLLAALGTCTAMTLRMYASRKGWPLHGVTVRLSHSKIHAKDCAEFETREGRIDQIECGLELTGDLDDVQRTRLLDIANKCPVHRTLKAEVHVRTSLV